MSNSFFDYINKMYEKQTYLDKYGDSVVGTGFILFIFFLVFQTRQDPSILSNFRSTEQK